jgi:hypothetical protein
MLELIMSMRPHFTEEDKKACEPIIPRLIALANLARKEGTLALVEAVESEPDMFLKQAVMFIWDGVGPKKLRKILMYMILSSNLAGAELLRLFIIAEGVLLIQKGENPTLILKLLGILLGIEYVERLLAEEKAAASYVPTLEEFLKKYGNVEDDRDYKWQSVNDELLKAALDEFKAHEIATALQGGPSIAVHKVMGLLDADRQSEVIEEVERMGPIRYLDKEEATAKIFAELDKFDTDKYGVFNETYIAENGKKVKLRIFKTPQGENTFEITDDNGKIGKVCSSYRQLSAHVLLELTDRNVITDEVVTELWALRNRLMADKEVVI